MSQWFDDIELKEPEGEQAVTLLAESTIEQPKKIGSNWFEGIELKPIETKPAIDRELQISFYNVAEQTRIIDDVVNRAVHMSWPEKTVESISELNLPFETQELLPGITLISQSDMARISSVERFGSGVLDAGANLSNTTFGQMWTRQKLKEERAFINKTYGVADDANILLQYAADETYRGRGDMLPAGIKTIFAEATGWLNNEQLGFGEQVKSRLATGALRVAGAGAGTVARVFELPFVAVLGASEKARIRAEIQAGTFGQPKRVLRAIDDPRPEIVRRGPGIQFGLLTATVSAEFKKIQEQHPEVFATRRRQGIFASILHPSEALLDAVETLPYMGAILTATATTGGVGGFLIASSLGASELFNSMVDAGTDPRDALMLSTLFAPIHGGLEFAQIDRIAKGIPGWAKLKQIAAKKIAGAAAKDIADRAKKGIVREIGKDVLKGWVTEGLQEALQTGLEGVLSGEEISALVEQMATAYIKGGNTGLILGGASTAIQLSASSISGQGKANMARQIAVLMDKGVPIDQASRFVFAMQSERLSDTSVKARQRIGALELKSRGAPANTQNGTQSVAAENLTLSEQEELAFLQSAVNDPGVVSEAYGLDTEADALIGPSAEEIEAEAKAAPEVIVPAPIEPTVTQEAEAAGQQTIVTTTEKGIETVEPPRILVSKETYETAKARLATPPETTTTPEGFRKGAAIDPQFFADLVTVGAYHLETGARKFGEWSQRVLAEVGEVARPHLRAIWETIQSSPETKERQFITSVREQFDKLNVSGQYVPRSTDELSIKARNLIEGDIDTAEKLVEEESTEASVATASELIKFYSAQAEEAQTESMRNILFDKAAAIANSMAVKLTELGRAVQAASILARITPEGQVKFAAKEIQRYNKQVADGTFPWWKFMKPIPELTGEQAQQILKETRAIGKMPDGREKQLRRQKHQEKMSALVPTPLFDKLITIWKAGLLTGLKTSGLNIIANVSHEGSEILKDIPAAMIDRVQAVFTGKRHVSFTVRGVPAGTIEGVKRMVDYIRTGYDERDIGSKLDFERKSFGTSKAARGAQVYTDFVFRLLGGEDQPFFYGAYFRSMYEQAKVVAINQKIPRKDRQTFINNLADNPTDQMIANANGDATTAVFQNKTSLGDVAKGFQNLASGAGQIVVPFGRTPSAVAMQSLSYSPVGIAKPIIAGIRKGEFTREHFQEMGRGVVGSGVMFIGGKLFAAGLMALDWPTDKKEQEQWRLEGKKANSIKIGGKWRTVQSLGPAGIALLFGGHLKKSFDESGSFSEASINASLGVLKSFREQTFLRGLQDTFNALNEPERWGMRVVNGLIASTVPTIVGDVARTMDDRERRAFTAFQKITAKLPHFRAALEPVITTLGEEKLPGINPLWRMLDPTRPSKALSSPVIDELGRLFKTGYQVTPNLLGGRKGFSSLTDEENTQLWKESGSLINDALEIEINKEEYKELPDDLKAKEVKRIVFESEEYAMTEALNRKTGELIGFELAKELNALWQDGFISKSRFQTYKDTGLITEEDFFELRKQGLLTDQQLLSLIFTASPNPPE